MINREIDRLVTPKEAGELLAQRARKNDEDMRLVKDRWRQRIYAALRKGELKLAEGKLRLIEVAEWARLKRSVPQDWLTRLQDLPSRPTSGELRIEIRSSGELRVSRPPLTPAEMLVRIIELEGVLLEKDRLIAILQPKAERYDQIRTKNQASARRKRS